MNYTEKDIKTIKSMMEELRIYRNADEEPREMAIDGLYSEEIELANKLGVELEGDFNQTDFTDIIKVVNKEWDEMTEEYIFTLENGEKIKISEKNYDTVMLHSSENGKIYKAVVDEHEDEVEEPVEYLGFELM